MNEYINKKLREDKNKTGGRVKGPGTGTSDSIALPLKKEGKTIAPAALSDGEFVIKADIVSNIGAGSTDPGFDFFDKFVKIVSQLDRELASDYADAILTLGEVYLEEQPQIDEEVTV